MRRSALYIEKGIWHGTEWAVFEPNDEPLCLKAKGSVGAIMHLEFRHEALVGRPAGEAYLVTCDPDSMTRDDMNNGNVICNVGFAPLRPAEFVIFRIGLRMKAEG